MAGNVTPANQRKWTDLLTVRNIIIAVVVIFALLLVVQNTDKGHFNFLFFDIAAPRWLWLVGVLAVGFAAGFLFERHRSSAKN